MRGAVLALSALATSTTLVAAEPSDGKALAEQFYDQGRALVKSEQWAEACPKFEASLRYEAALGTRLNLATCYEKIGRLASAWEMFRDAAIVALRAGDTARQDYAVGHANALLARLPKLTIVGPAKLPSGFSVKRDGVALDLATLGTALYIDPGAHEVTASAPEFEPFKTQITVGEGGSESVMIPELTPVKKQAQDKISAEGVERLKPRRTQKLVGIGVVGVGVLLAGTGLLFGVRASSTYKDAEALCGDELACQSDASYVQGSELVDRAHRQATFSTILAISGAVAVAAGIVVWVTAPKRERAETAVMPIVADRDFGLAIIGRF
jgi:tetratricopeptide (TPR) repeat protein